MNVRRGRHCKIGSVDISGKEKIKSIQSVKNSRFAVLFLCLLFDFILLLNASSLKEDWP